MSDREKLFERLSALDIDTSTLEHDPVYTVEESEGIHEKLDGGHTKNLFLKDAKGRLFLVVAQSHSTINLKTLHKTIGCGRLSFGKPDLLKEVLGVEPGSVSAFCVICDDQKKLEQVILDDKLMEFDQLNCHPLTNSATTTIQRDDLLRFMRDCGHEPRVMSIDDQDTQIQG